MTFLLAWSRATGKNSYREAALRAVEAIEDRRHFLSALGAFDREARDRHERGWLEIDESQQRETSRSASTLAPAQPMPLVWTKGQPRGGRA